MNYCRAVGVAGLLLIATQAGASEIIGCSNGDTCRLVSDAYTGDVNLFCIDAPELGQSPWGAKARDAINDEIRGTIRVMIDHVDDKGVIVAELIRDDGWNLGLELVHAGLAAVYPKYCDEPAYYAAEETAREAKVGIWRVDREKQRPREWRGN